MTLSQAVAWLLWSMLCASMGLMLGYISWGKQAAFNEALINFQEKYMFKNNGICAISDHRWYRRNTIMVTVLKGTDTSFIPMKWCGFHVWTEESEGIVAQCG